AGVDATNDRLHDLFSNGSLSHAGRHVQPHLGLAISAAALLDWGGDHHLVGNSLGLHHPWSWLCLPGQCCRQFRRHLHLRGISDNGHVLCDCHLSWYVPSFTVLLVKVVTTSPFLLVIDIYINSM